MLEVFKPRALNYFILSRLILLTLTVSRNQTLIHLPFSGTIFPLSPVFYLNELFLFFSFQKAFWDDFAFYFDPHSPSTKEYSSLSLSSAVALFTSLTLNGTKVPIPFCRIKGQSAVTNVKPGGLLTREKRLVKGKRLLLTLIKVMKIVRLTSLLPNISRLTSPNPRLRYGR